MSQSSGGISFSRRCLKLGHKITSSLKIKVDSECLHASRQASGWLLAQALAPGFSKPSTPRSPHHQLRLLVILIDLQLWIGSKLLNAGLTSAVKLSYIALCLLIDSLTGGLQVRAVTFVPAEESLENSLQPICLIGIHQHFSSSNIPHTP